MKKTFVFLIALLVTILAFSACSRAKNQADQLIDDSKKSYDNAAAEVKKVKDKTLRTVNELENAVEEIKEATNAVKEVTD